MYQGNPLLDNLSKFIEVLVGIQTEGMKEHYFAQRAAQVLEQIRTEYLECEIEDDPFEHKRD
jgi:hypothetical protein